MAGYETVETVGVLIRLKIHIERYKQRSHKW